MSAHRQNPADLLREYTVAELERIAEQYHAKTADGFTVPVDIDFIIESTPGINLDIYPRLKANHGILGMAGVNEDGTLTIYIDDELMDQDSQQRRARMTLAEEFAHILIHGEAIRHVKSTKDFGLIHNHPKWPIFDRNAKRLAAALLMPARTVIEDSSEWYSKVIAALPANMRYSNIPAVQKTVISKLADKYDVSFMSMQIRLGEWPIKVLEKIEEAMREGMDFLS
jgi:Zn-dependent peptidase ImmA (M78 family)